MRVAAWDSEPPPAAADSPPLRRNSPVPIRSQVGERERKKAATRWQLAGAAYNWLLWSLLVFLVGSQFLGVCWDTMTVDWPAEYGQSPLKGVYAINGYNDEPYSDRSFVCVLHGRTYLPLSVNEALALGTTKVVDTAGSAVNGYRVVKRNTNVVGSRAGEAYTHMCSMITKTIDTIFETCEVLGYNVTRDNLRIVDDVDSKRMHLIQKSLPILIMPFWDNCLTERFAIPGYDGSACMFRLVGEYLDPAHSSPLYKAVNRTVREAKTIEWLDRPEGHWRNGWYEDSTGMKWYSDVISSDNHLGFGIKQRQFNMLTGKELTWEEQKTSATMTVEYWGPKLSSVGTEVSMTSVAIANGNRYGLFMYSAHLLNKIKNVYDWETLLSNALIGRILFRWMMVMLTLRRGYSIGVDDWSNAGIGCLANYPVFKYLPVMLLPRLKMILFAFCAAGCQFEGQQRSLSDAWFVIYPAIVETMLLYYSLINLVAKLCRRRVSDVLFGPTVMFLCTMHWSRISLATSGWFEFDSRITTLISGDEVDQLTIVDFFTSNLALRANGNIKSLFFIKLATIAVNLLPFLWSSLGTNEATATQTSRVENVLAIRVSCAGGMGQSCAHSQPHSRAQVVDSAQRKTLTALNSYEVIRLGYIVCGDESNDSPCFLISFDDWDLLTLMFPLRKLTYLWNYRVKVFSLVVQGDVAVIALEPEMCHTDDPQLLGIRWWQVRGQAIK